MGRARIGTAGVAVALVAALAAAVSGSCFLQLDHRLACGDGYVDDLAGEDCDPGDPSSYEDGCSGTLHPDGTAACDPELCILINTAEQCAVCGDDIIDEDRDEECDGDNLGGATCPGGAPGTLTCSSDCKLDTSLCDLCGNQTVDEGEECDSNTPGTFVSVRLCAGSDGQDPLPSPLPNKPYSSGETRECGDNCQLRRVSCGYCNDGVRDLATPVDFEGNSTLPEWCDGDSFDENRLLEEFGANYCENPEGERPNVGCADDCLGFVERPRELGRCCRRKSEPCPNPGASIKCCFEFDHPDEEECEDIFEDGSLIRAICR